MSVLSFLNNLLQDDHIASKTSVTIFEMAQKTCSILVSSSHLTLHNIKYAVKSQPFSKWNKAGADPGYVKRGGARSKRGDRVADITPK